MAKLRLIFAKDGRAIYISHLDLLRTFQRVFLREGLVIKHSQGFHPHPIMSFAMPLPVGQSSACEVLDFEVNGEMDGSDLPQRLNRFMPEGIRALECYPLQRPVRDLARLHSRVEFEYDNGVPEGAEQAMQELFRRESVVIQKRTKRREMADVDIRPLLFSMETVREGNLLVLDVVVAAQNPGMNPALLEAAAEKYLPEMKPDFVRVHRIAFLDGEGNLFR